MVNHEGHNGCTLPEDIYAAFREDPAERVPEVATDANYDTSELVVLPDAQVVITAIADANPAPFTTMELSDLRDHRFDENLPIPDSRFSDF